MTQIGQTAPVRLRPESRRSPRFTKLSEGNLIALHGFIKKTQKTPDDELAVARKRLKELQS
jgi:phage-related protein